MRTYEATEQAYKKGYEKGKADALKWIPVTERLPTMDDTDETGVVLVYTENNEHLIVDSASVWRFRDFITHWMPLPEPPKGE